MLLLAFDTAGPAVSVAVHDGTGVLAQAGAQGAMAHGELLAPTIEQVLRQAQVEVGELTDIAVGVGPGPYTGLRVGIVTAAMLAQTRELALHPVCSLDIVAPELPGRYLVALDARRREVYWAQYLDGRRVDGPQVTTPAELAAKHPGVPVLGGGAELYPDLLGAGEFTGSGGPWLDPSAARLASLVAEARVPELPLRPLYLRRPDANPVAQSGSTESS